MYLSDDVRSFIEHIGEASLLTRDPDILSDLSAILLKINKNTARYKIYSDVICNPFSSTEVASVYRWEIIGPDNENIEVGISDAPYNEVLEMVKERIRSL